MQSPQSIEKSIPWPEIKMIGISEKDLGPKVRNFEGCQRFYCGLRANRHKERRAHLIVCGVKCRRPGVGAGGLRFDVEIEAAVGHGRTEDKRACWNS